MALIDQEVPLEPPDSFLARSGIVGGDDFADWLRSLAASIGDTQRALKGRLREGDPTHPVDSTNQPNGLLHNMEGSWVTVEFAALNTATTIQHNLSLPTTGTSNSSPNVVWKMMGVKHSGVGTLVTDSVSVVYDIGDAIGSDSIELRAFSGGARTVAAGANALTVLLFLYGVEPW